MVYIEVESEQYVAYHEPSGKREELGYVHHTMIQDAILTACEVFDVTVDQVLVAK